MAMTDDKTAMTQKLLKELMSVMKMNTGGRMKPAVAEVTIEKPDEEDKDALKAHLEDLAAKSADAESHDDDMDLDGLMEGEPDDGEDNDEPLTGASARMAKLAAMRKRGC